MNRVTLFGNVGRDPEVRATNDGTKVATITLATTDRWKDKGSGEQKEKTEWHRVVVFGALADVIGKYVHKGDKLLVEGQIQTRKWVDQSGQEKYTTEVRLLTFDFGGNKRNDSDSAAAGGGAAAPAKRSPGKQTDLEDDIPWA